MKLTGDITSPRIMVLKASLFAAAASLACVALAMRQASLRDGLISTLVFVVGAWCLCRSYYFAFYVIERYCDPGYKYAGVLSAARWAMKRRGDQPRAASDPTSLSR